MNRICIKLDKNGELRAIAADEPLEIFIVDPSVPHDRVYQYEAAHFGPENVRHMIGGYPVGHAADGTLEESDGTGKRPPSRPSVRLID